MKLLTTGIISRIGPNPAQSALACQTWGMAISEPVSVSIEVRASATAVYAAISDIRQMPRWSPELDRVSTPHAGPLTVGDRFAGYNHRGFQFWRTTSTVTAAVPNRLFAYEVTASGLPVARWSYQVTDHGPNCEVTQTWSDLRAGPFGIVMKGLGFAATGVWDRGTHNHTGMAQTLAALKADLESR